MSDNILWYKKPARKWIQGMPIGNGWLGAMVQGKLRNEVITINDDTVWARGPEDRNNPDGFKYLSKIRKLLLDGEVEEAAVLAEASMIGIPKRQSPYQVLGELHLNFTDHYDDSVIKFDHDHAENGNVHHYCRSLDIENALAQVEYEMKGTRYKREHFISGADGVFVTHISARGKKEKINLMLTLYRRFDAETTVVGTNRIMLCGQCGINGSKFCTLLNVDAPGAQITAIGSHLYIKGADTVNLTLTSETNIRENEYARKCKERLDAAQKYDYDNLKARHIEEYQSYYNRMSFTLKNNNLYDTPLPTNERLAKLRQGARDLSLITLYFNFGRYLLISSSRSNSMPANLQGIWNDSFAPPWDSKFTININTEMNYWPAEPCGLGDCHKPLLDMLDRARVNGRDTAKRLYGCNGFVIHHNMDMWCDTAPLDGIRSGMWPMGGAWLCYHLWEHYEYSLNHTFLSETAYPIMQEAVEFLLGYMFEDEAGQLLTGPSISPENRYILPDGQVGYLCISPAMDTQIVLGLFKRFVAAAKALGIDNDFVGRVKASIAKLPPMKIGQKGCLQEWLEDHIDGEPGHRHISHLFAVYPDNQITKEDTPELYDAARKTLEHRIQNGSGGTGWSEAWIIALWARFKEGDLAFEAVETLLKDLTEDSLLDIHPPGIFQIDGNLGAVAGMLELLAQQSDNESITLFPALPAAWEEGEVKGLHLKGGLVADIKWGAGKATVNFSANVPIVKKISIGKDDMYVTDINLGKGESCTLELDIHAINLAEKDGH